MDIISLITSSSAVFVGALYAIGFIIIVFNLSQYGLEEYQLLNVKYLHVGFTFAGYSLAFFSLGYLISLFLYVSIWNKIVSWYLMSNILAAISLIGSFTTVVLIVGGKSKKKISVKAKGIKYWQYYFLVIISIISNIFPAYALVLLTFNSLNTTYMPWIYFIEFGDVNSPILVVAIWALFFILQIMYYSRFIYGKPNPLSKVDRTGVGIPNKVQFLLDEKFAKLLSRSQIPIKGPGVTDILNLIETTSNDYIVMVPFTESTTAIEGKVIKISKNNIFAVVYYPDDFQ